MKKKTKIFFIKLFIIFILFASVSMFLLWILNKRLIPLIFNYAKIETEKIINISINNSTKSEIIEKLDSNQLFTIIKNNNGDIIYIDYNSIIVNQFLDRITNNIQEDLILISKGDLKSLNGYSSHDDGFIFKFHLGVLTNNLLLNNAGPVIPIKLSLIGFINSNVNINVKEYGINNAIVELYVKIDVKARIVLPFASKDIVVTNMIPISFKIIQGTVPDYYQNGISSNSNLFSIPLK